MGRYIRLAFPLALAFLLLIQVYALAQNSTLSDGLVACWDMNEVSGTRYDSIGGYHLTDNNTVGSTSGYYDIAAAPIMSNSEHLNIVDDPGLTFTSTTVYMLFDRHTTVTSGDKPFDKPGEYLFYVSGSNYQCRFYRADITVSVGPSVASTNWPAGTFVPTICRYDREKTCIDTPYDSGCNTPVSPQDLRDTASDLLIPRSGGASHDAYYDVFAIWDRALTDSETDLLLNTGIGRDCASILSGGSGTSTEIPLPSGRIGSLQYSITAGEVAIASGVLFMIMLSVYFLMSRRAIETRASNK